MSGNDRLITAKDPRCTFSRITEPWTCGHRRIEQRLPCARNPARTALFPRGPPPRTLKRKTRLGRRVCIPAEAGRKDRSMAGLIFPYLADFRKPRFLPRVRCAMGKPFPGGLRCNPGGPMLAFVPVAFDVYRPLKPRLRWAMQCLVSFADHAGRCFPSIRTFAQHAGISKSSAGRDLAALVDTGLITRKRRPGGVYVYRVDRRFLPKWPKRKVSQDWDGQTGAASSPQSDRSIGAVPAQGTKEKPNKKNQGWARGRARFAKPRMIETELPDDTAKWEARLRSWRKSHFWLPFWGPKPSEPDCWAPKALQSCM